VHYFEIWNEPGNTYAWLQGPNAREFAALVKAVAPIIRSEAPQAKIALGSMGGSPSRHEGGLEHRWLYECIDEGVGPVVDVIGWHPFYNVDPDSDYFRRYPSLVREFQEYAREHGFKGTYMATEVNWGTWPGEMRKSKIFLRAFLTNMGLGVTPFLNNAFDGSIYWNMTLLRNTFSQNPYNVVMPEAGYYAIRTLSTVMEQATVAKATAEFTDATAPYESYAFSRPGGELLVAIIAPGPVEDTATRIHRTGVRIKGFRASGVAGIDLINGVEQELKFQQEGPDVFVGDLHVADYPLLLRVRRGPISSRIQ
jgi:hypothetical protein